MSALETIRNIPVIKTHRNSYYLDNDKPEKNNIMDIDYSDDDDSGFPFDNSGAGRRSRDPFEDIAQRHPEFAQHLQGFPSSRRSQRNPSDQQDQDQFLRRRFERPFASGRFERFGFPFDRDDFEREPQRYYEAYPEYFENFQNQNPQSPLSSQKQQQQQTSPGYQQYPPHYSQQYQPQPSENKTQTAGQSVVTQGTQTEDLNTFNHLNNEDNNEPIKNCEFQDSKPESGQTTRGRPIQQSNTIDLSQYQPSEDDLNDELNDREQRSMSAPPTENNNKRFTSSVNIPMGATTIKQENNNTENMKSHAPGSGSTERVIPIHVEGRDVPVMPKNASSSSHQQPQHQAERMFTDSPRSHQPEQIFGRRPEAFTQFVNRDPSSHHHHPRFGSNDHWHSFGGGFPSQDDFGFTRSESPSRFSNSKTQQQQNASPQQPKQQQQQQQTPQSRGEQKFTNESSTQSEIPPPASATAQQKQPLSSMEQIQLIQKDVANLLRQVEAFNGMPKDKNCLYLDEMLTRNLLKLDNVDTMGQDSIRSARKETIKSIERTIGLLEAKAAANAAPKTEEKMEIESSAAASLENKAANDNKIETEPEITTATTTDQSSDGTEKMEVVVVAEQHQPQEKNDEEKAKNEEKPDVAATLNAEEVKDAEIKIAEEPKKSEDSETVSTVQGNEEQQNENGKVADAEAAKPEPEKKEKKKVKKKQQVNKEEKKE